jgi:hypothetical protein
MNQADSVGRMVKDPPWSPLRKGGKDVVACRVSGTSSRLVLLVALAAVAGCHGYATISGVPYARRDLPDNEPLISRLPTAAKGVWYVDEQERLDLAFAYDGLALGDAKNMWRVSIGLEGLPAGRSREYRIARDQMRGLYSVGMDHRRFQSRWGVLVLDRVGRDRFRGRFQITAAQQRFTVFTGWSPEGDRAPLLILLGEFEVVQDPAMGRAIRRDVDAEDWSSLGPIGGVRIIRRAPTTASQPAP